MELNELTYLINGCAMKVHRQLGCGFQELIYQRAMEIEFRAQKIDYIREGDQTIYYKGKEVGTRRADFIINDLVVLELKAVSEFLPNHFIQAKNYVTAYNLPIGLLLNFGTKSLQIKKIYSSNSIYKQNLDENSG